MTIGNLLSFVLITDDFSMDKIHSKNQQVMILRNPSVRRDSLFVACLFFLLFPASPCFSQGITGFVIDHLSSQPIPSIQIKFSQKDSILAIIRTNKEGRFNFKSTASGQVQIFIEAKGFESFYLDAITLDGYTTHRITFHLEKRALELEGVTVVASHPSEHINVYKITKDDLNTIAGNFDDPVRIALSKPGFVAINDQANHFSARGHSPVFNTWHLEGLLIANPNHTNNAGFIDDKPNQLGGGINMFSAQALGSTEIYPGFTPYALQNNGGAAINMSLHETVKPEWRAKAGFLGFELGGGVLLGKFSSLDINLRYSFTGLLANMGVDFSGEKIGFYDGVVSFANQSKRHKFKWFAWAGRSDNEFEMVEDPAERETYKDHFNIDYGNTIAGSGLRYDLQLNSSLYFKSGLAVSSNISSYLTEGAFEGPFRALLSEDDIVMFSSFFDFTWSHSENFQTTLGVRSVKRILADRRYFNYPLGELTFIHPYAQSVFSLTTNLRAELGVDLYKPFGGLPGSLGGKALLRYYAGSSILHAGYQRGVTESYQGGLFIFSQRPVLFDNIEAGWHLSNAKHRWGASIYYQVMNNTVFHLSDDPYLYIEDYPYPQFGGPAIGKSFSGRSTYYGIEASWQMKTGNGWRWEINQSLFKNARESRDSVLESGRYDNRFTSNIIIAKEVVGKKKNKNRIWNFSLRGMLNGGLREPMISFGQSDLFNTTIFRFPGNYTEQLPMYKRIDLSASRVISTSKFRWRYSLDIQNVIGFRNVAYHYFEPVTSEILEKEQLGIIPVLSIQVSW